MEFTENDILSTGKIAKYCQVHLSTVHKWINNRDLNAYQLPGSGQFRVQAKDFLQFLKKFKIPTPGVVMPSHEKPRILIVDDEENVAKAIFRQLHEAGQYELEMAFGGFEAGRKLESLRPQLLILDLLYYGFHHKLHNMAYLN